MAEFVDVVKKRYEICDYYEQCEECPLFSANNSHGLGCGSFIRCYPEETERIIMDWEKPVDLSVDWSKIEVDTPILVRQSKNYPWLKRYFAKYEDGIVYAWLEGKTSWSAENTGDCLGWEYAKLAGGTE